jgi:response regulator RpfG family c-di-GMP phosphodiesterase
MKLTDNMPPRAMKSSEDTEKELRNLIYRHFFQLSKEEQVKYLMTETKGHYSPSMIKDFIESQKEIK